MRDQHEASLKWVLLPSHLTDDIVKMLWPVNLKYDGCYRDRYLALIEACSAKENLTKTDRIAGAMPAESCNSSNWDQGMVSIKIQWPNGSEIRKFVSGRTADLLYNSDL